MRMQSRLLSGKIVCAHFTAADYFVTELWLYLLIALLIAASRRALNQQDRIWLNGSSVKAVKQYNTCCILVPA